MTKDNSILIDNWTIEDWIDYSDSTETADRSNLKTPNTELLEMILFWDNIYYPSNSKSSYWRDYIANENFKRALHPMADDNVSYMNITKEMLSEAYNHKFGNMEIGAIRYMLLSNHFKINYYPCNERCKFFSTMKESGNMEKIKRQLSEIAIVYDEDSFHSERRNVLTELNQSLLDYYDNLTGKLGAGELCFPEPILTKYVAETKPDTMNYYEYALVLRNSKKLQNYRKYLREMENCLNFNKTEQIGEVLEQMGELLEQINNQIPAIGVGKMIANIIPSFITGIDRVNKKIQRRIQLSFERDLRHYVACKAKQQE